MLVPTPWTQFLVYSISKRLMKVALPVNASIMPRFTPNQSPCIEAGEGAGQVPISFFNSDLGSWASLTLAGTQLSFEKCEVGKD
jgi:hypothetical protein